MVAVFSSLYDIYIWDLKSHHREGIGINKGHPTDFIYHYLSDSDEIIKVNR